MSSRTTRTRPAVPAKCTSCEHPMESPLYCGHCRSLYPADGLSYFELLGLPAAYDVDAEEVRRRYLAVSRGVHPDRHGASQDASVLGMRVSAQLNEAYRVLSDPIHRAEYLLELRGGPSATDDKRVQDGVLAETLSLRDELAEAQATGNRDAVEAALAAARASRDRLTAEIESLARQLPADERTRERLRAALNSIKYYRKILEEA